MVSATCATTSVWRTRSLVLPPAMLRVPSDNASRTSCRPARSAVASPSAAAVSTATVVANSMAVRSTLTSCTRGRLAGCMATSVRTPPNAIATPVSMAATDRTMASASSCRAMRPRPAPTASRTASSRRRVDARASCMFETLRHAITSSTTAALKRMQQHRPRAWPSSARAVERPSHQTSRCQSPCSCLSARDSPLNSATARSCVMPSANRAMTTKL